MTLDLRRSATTITAFRPTASGGHQRQVDPANGSQIYLFPLPAARRACITQNAPSYWHGWSPDGKTLAFCRASATASSTSIPFPPAGGDETRLTTAKGLDDGPEYTRDGKYIYFNSERTGHMQIWRMKADGCEQEQVLFDDPATGFRTSRPTAAGWSSSPIAPGPQASPEQGCELRLMSLDGQEDEVLAKLFGGQGTINVPSWSPDSKKVAFVSYVLAPEEKSK